MARAATFEDQLRERLEGACRIVVVGIGDECNAQDRLGMDAARGLRDLQLENLEVMLAGTVPESVTAPIRRFRPDHVILVDAIEMDKPPGTVQIVAPGHVEARFFSTHVLPLPVVMKFISEDAQAKVTLVGIQPDLANESEARTPEEQAGLAILIGALRRALTACLFRH